MRVPARTDDWDKIVDTVISLVGDIRTGQVTLTPNDTTTVVTGKNLYGLDENFIVCLSPATESATLAWGGESRDGPGGTVYLSSIGKNTFTITHDSDAADDRTFNWIAVAR